MRKKLLVGMVCVVIKALAMDPQANQIGGETTEVELGVLSFIKKEDQLALYNESNEQAKKFMNSFKEEDFEELLSTAVNTKTVKSRCDVHQNPFRLCVNSIHAACNQIYGRDADIKKDIYETCIKSLNESWRPQELKGKLEQYRSDPVFCIFAVYSEDLRSKAALPIVNQMVIYNQTNAFAAQMARYLSAEETTEMQGSSIVRKNEILFSKIFNIAEQGAMQIAQLRKENEALRRTLQQNQESVDLRLAALESNKSGNEVQNPDTDETNVSLAQFESVEQEGKVKFKLGRLEYHGEGSTSGANGYGIFSFSSFSIEGEFVSTNLRLSAPWKIKYQSKSIEVDAMQSDKCFDITYLKDIQSVNKKSNAIQVNTPFATFVFSKEQIKRVDKKTNAESVISLKDSEESTQ